MYMKMLACTIPIKKYIYWEKNTLFPFHTSLADVVEPYDLKLCLESMKVVSNCYGNESTLEWLMKHPVLLDKVNSYINLRWLLRATILQFLVELD